MSKSPNRIFGVVLGVVCLLAGILGFFITSSTDFAATEGPKLIDLFEVNPLHNLAHIIVGAALLIAALAGANVSRGFNTVIGIVFLLVGVAGLFISGGDNSLNVLALNGADNVLNFATAVVLLVVGLGADRSIGAAKAA